MNNEQIAKYKTKLEQERKLLLAEIKESEKPTTLGTDIGDEDEDTDEAEEMSNQIAIANDLKKRLDEIDIALGKIQKGDSGKFGVCENCGKQIGEDVLEISPESQLCKECKLKK
jgi:DnaK suppressor protein